MMHSNSETSLDNVLVHGNSEPEVSDRTSDAGITTNWVTSPNGDIVPSDVRLFPGNGDGTYEVEFRCVLVGLSIGTDFDTEYIVVQDVSLR